MLNPERPFALRRFVSLAALVVAAALGAMQLIGGDDAPPGRGTAPQPLPRAATAPAKATPDASPTEMARAAGIRLQRRRISDRLGAAVTDAARLGGAVEAAVMLDEWKAPVVARATGRRASVEVRMWSVSKVAAAVTLLRAMGWGDRAGDAVGPELAEALDGALTRSENCRQRRVVLGLQELTGSTDRAAEQVAQSFAVAGARPQIAHATIKPDPVCAGYLAQIRGVRAPRARALTLGTSRWRVADAARFAHTLGSGGYGTAVARELLGRLRRSKGPSRESPRANYTADLQWGAGLALTCLRPAFKAGWGGALAHRFVAEQIAIVTRAGATGSIAVTFRPLRQPPLDDPGVTVAPAGIELVMGRMATDLGAPARTPQDPHACAASPAGG